MQIRWMEYKNRDGEKENFYPITHVDAIVGVNNIKAEKEFAQASLNLLDWSDTAPYTQTVQVEDVLEVDILTIECIANVSSLAEKKELQKAWNMVDKIESGDGCITAYCYFEKPSITIPLTIRK